MVRRIVEHTVEVFLEFILHILVQRDIVRTRTAEVSELLIDYTARLKVIDARSQQAVDVLRFVGKLWIRGFQSLSHLHLFISSPCAALVLILKQLSNFLCFTFKGLSRLYETCLFLCIFRASSCGTQIICHHFVVSSGVLFLLIFCTDGASDQTDEHVVKLFCLTRFSNIAVDTLKSHIRVFLYAPRSVTVRHDRTVMYGVGQQVPCLRISTCHHIDSGFAVYHHGAIFSSFTQIIVHIQPFTGEGGSAPFLEYVTRSVCKLLRKATLPQLTCQPNFIGLFFVHFTSYLFIVGNLLSNLCINLLVWKRDTFCFRRFKQCLQ